MLLVTKNEEQTFWLLKILTQDVTKDYYTKTMSGLIEDISILEQLLDQRVPALCQHIDKLGMTLTTVTTKWFICLLSEVLPVETTLRVWDCLFFEGRKVFIQLVLLMTIYILHQSSYFLHF